LASNGSCIHQDDMPLKPIDYLPNGNYHVSSGYRRIPGDTCINGLTLDTPLEIEINHGASKFIKNMMIYHHSSDKISYYLHLFFVLMDSLEGQTHFKKAFSLLLLTLSIMGGAASSLVYYARHPDILERYIFNYL
jgi:hypothetical protein